MSKIAAADRGRAPELSPPAAEPADVPDVVALIDALIERPVLVFGSLPPVGRDIDLLARDPELRALAAGLQGAGFSESDGVWVRFEHCSASVVELVDAASWRLEAGELAALYAEALLLPGAERLVRPAPRHALLIMARKLARARGPLDKKHRDRVTDALLEDPGAWSGARRSAAAWGCARELATLERRFGLPASDPDAGRPGPAASPRRMAGAVRRRLRRRGVVIALSGLDGCGKSSQARHVQDALIQAGLGTSVIWTSVMSQPQGVATVKAIANRALAAAAAIRRLVPGSKRSAPSAEAEDRANALRRGSSSVSLGWALLQGTVNAVRQRRATRAALRRGEVVICDRYVLDALVHLRYAYGQRRGAWLLRRIPPRADLTFFFDLPPEVASARQPEYEPAQNAERARLYRELGPALDAIWIDATLPRDEICALIARQTWQLAS